MPFLKIITNVPKSKIPINFLINLTNLLETVLKKPRAYCCVQIQTDQILSFGCSYQPCAIVTLSSVGRLGPGQNKILSEVIMQVLEENIGVIPYLTYIIFQDVQPSDIQFV
jgi:phenylpyruvate tautomerase